MKPKILIVDDNLFLRETMRSILEARFPALRVFEAGDGKEAFAQIHDELPDLILMDISLPGENGLKLTRKIKDIYPEIAIIIFTDYEMPQYRKAAYENGADYFFAKSWPDGKKLSTAVKSILASAGLNNQ